MMADELELTESEERQRFISRIMLIDRLYLTAVNDDQARKTPPPKPSNDTRHGS